MPGAAFPDENNLRVHLVLHCLKNYLCRSVSSLARKSLQSCCSFSQMPSSSYTPILKEVEFLFLLAVSSPVLHGATDQGVAFFSQL